MLVCRGGDATAACAYEALEVIGHGSFGTVYLAEDASRPGCHLALKMVSCKREAVDPEFSPWDQAVAEARLLQKLNHPHIIRCREWFEDHGNDSRGQKLWIVLDHMDGGDLNTLYNTRRRAFAAPPDALFVRRVISSVGGALEYVHGLAILHRDVKCANVLLSQDKGKIVLADFGLACSVKDIVGNEQAAVGTPSYLSPEVLVGRPHSIASDSWALGVVSFKLAALRRPFEARDSLTLTMKIVKSEPRELPQFCPADIACAVSGFLVKDQQKRLRPAEAMVLTSDSPLSTLSRTPFRILPRRLSAL